MAPQPSQSLRPFQSRHPIEIIGCLGLVWPAEEGFHSSKYPHENDTGTHKEEQEQEEEEEEEEEEKEENKTKQNKKKSNQINKTTTTTYWQAEMKGPKFIMRDSLVILNDSHEFSPTVQPQ